MTGKKKNKSRTTIPQKLNRQTVFMLPLGCPKNQVDAETLLGRVEKDRIVQTPEEADIIIINTCGFIDSAKEESIEAILEAVRLKEKNKQTEVVVMGCLSQRYKKELQSAIPEIDRLYGVHQIDQIAQDLGCPTGSKTFRRLLNPAHYAYLKISDGCNHRCGFCAIPGIRGPLVSVPSDTLLREARFLASRGVKELILVSQDTTAYGFDWPGTNKKTNGTLIDLLEQLHGIAGIEWIRLMYFYPSLISRDLLRAMAVMPKVCKYVDVPVQHISANVLKAMRRQSRPEQIYRMLEMIREEIPDVAIRTSLIVGHPMESRKDFQELYRMVEQIRFDRLGVFPYSPEDGTPSARLRPQCAPSTRQARYETIMELQQTISQDNHRRRIGTTMKVLIDRKEADIYYGRTEYDAPDVDGEVCIGKSLSVSIGHFSDIYITDADAYDLTGRPVNLENEVKH